MCEKGQEAHKETDGSTTVRFWLSNCAVWLKNSDVLHVPPLVGDRDKLVQVVTNLVSNAIKYSLGGTITVALTCDARADTGGAAGPVADGRALVHLRVRDEGMGIPPEALETVFERYARIESTSTRYIAGTGLGLPIVRQLVEAHGGRVWAESTRGAGSTFHVTIPVAAAADTSPVATPDGTALRERSSDGAHRLL